MPAPDPNSEGSNWRRWLGPLAVTLLFLAVIYVIHRELTHVRLRDIAAQLAAIPRASLLTSAALTAASYWTLTCYDLLGLRYLRRRVPYLRSLFTSFIAYAFGHNLSLGALTGAAIRFRLYAGAGLTGTEVATLSGFCSLTSGLGLTSLAALSLLVAPAQAGTVLHVNPNGALLVGALLAAGILTYLLWASLSHRPLALRGWALQAPGPAIASAQLVLGVLDISLSSAVLYWLLPAQAHISFITFAGAYAVAAVAGILSHVPGGLGVFESVIVLVLPELPADALLGSLIAYRALYYLGPLTIAALLFGAQELAAQRQRLARVEALARLSLAPVVPQVTGSLVFVAGFVLLISGATPGVDTRLAVLREFLPLSVLELSHLAGSIVGVALLILSRALFKRVRVAYHATFWLLVAGIAASLLKGLDYEEAVLLALILGVLTLGRDAFYRPTSIMQERFTPAWIASLVVVIVSALWLGYLEHRHVEYSNELWWTFSRNADAPRMLRASLAVVVLATTFLLANLLRPARPAPGVASNEELARTRAAIASSHSSLANAALTGDKRLLFADGDRAFLMYQVAGRSWVALGDPVGPAEQHEDLVWRFRELSDRHGGWTAFYQVSAERLPLYVDLGLAAMKLGEEARVPLAEFSLDGAARADLRQAHRRALRDGASFEVVPPERVPEFMPQLQRISDAWLEDKAAAEKRFSVGAFSPQYLAQFPLALVRCEGHPVAFANIWPTATRTELSVDLMRFGADAPRGAMDYLFIELMLWGRGEGYRWFNLGMAPLWGLENHPLAPAWHRVGNFVFRHGEHFYNFDGLRRYKTKFDPVWEPRYLMAPGGITLPRILIDVSRLIAGGVKEVFVK